MNSGDIIANRITLSSRVSYKSYINAFMRLSLVPLPLLTDDQVIQAFTPFQGQREGYITTLKAAIAAYQLDNGMPPPPWGGGGRMGRARRESPALIAFFQGLMRAAPPRVFPGDSGTLPMPVHVLHTLVNYWIDQRQLCHFRNAIMALGQFYLMRRAAEMRNIKQGDLVDLGVGRGMELRVRSMKHVRTGHRVTIVEHVHDSRPLAPLFRLYLQATRNLRGFIMRSTTPDGNKWAKVDKAVSLTSYNQSIVKALQIVAPYLHERCWSSHALRKGGFTHARETGMPMEVANRIVGWITSDM
jgi:hypothetical protein